MAVMNVVWPVSALFGTLLSLWGYFRYGVDAAASPARERGSSTRPQPFPVIVATGTLHCGAGCVIGDVAAEWLAFAVPVVAVWMGWNTIFAQKTFAVWVLDFVFAFLLGIVFQYMAIVTMRGLSFGKGLLAALKADTLSLLSWQVGMVGFMAWVQFCWFRRVLGTGAAVDAPEFWFAMQLAMVAGFVTAYPVNWWLIRTGIKEPM